MNTSEYKKHEIDNKGAEPQNAKKKDVKNTFRAKAHEGIESDYLSEAEQKKINLLRKNVHSEISEKDESKIDGIIDKETEDKNNHKTSKQRKSKINESLITRAFERSGVFDFTDVEIEEIQEAIKDCEIRGEKYPAELKSSIQTRKKNIEKIYKFIKENNNNEFKTLISLFPGEKLKEFCRKIPLSHYDDVARLLGDLGDFHRAMSDLLIESKNSPLIIHGIAKALECSEKKNSELDDPLIIKNLNDSDSFEFMYCLCSNTPLDFSKDEEYSRSRKYSLVKYKIGYTEWYLTNRLPKHSFIYRYIFFFDATLIYFKYFSPSKAAIENTQAMLITYAKKRLEACSLAILLRKGLRKDFGDIRSFNEKLLEELKLVVDSYGKEFKKVKPSAVANALQPLFTSSEQHHLPILDVITPYCVQFKNIFICNNKIEFLRIIPSFNEILYNLKLVAPDLSNKLEFILEDEKLEYSSYQKNFQQKINDIEEILKNKISLVQLVSEDDQTYMKRILSLLKCKIIIIELFYSNIEKVCESSKENLLYFFDNSEGISDHSRLKISPTLAMLEQYRYDNSYFIGSLLNKLLLSDRPGRLCHENLDKIKFISELCCFVKETLGEENTSELEKIIKLFHKNLIKSSNFNVNFSSLKPLLLGLLRHCKIDLIEYIWTHFSQKWSRLETELLDTEFVNLLLKYRNDKPVFFNTLLENEIKRGFPDSCYQSQDLLDYAIQNKNIVLCKKIISKNINSEQAVIFNRICNPSIFSSDLLVNLFEETFSNADNAIQAFSEVKETAKELQTFIIQNRKINPSLFNGLIGNEIKKGLSEICYQIPNLLGYATETKNIGLCKKIILKMRFPNDKVKIFNKMIDCKQFTCDELVEFFNEIFYTYILRMDFFAQISLIKNLEFLVALYNQCSNLGEEYRKEIFLLIASETKLISGLKFFSFSDNIIFQILKKILKKTCLDRNNPKLWECIHYILEKVSVRKQILAKAGSWYFEDIIYYYLRVNNLKPIELMVHHGVSLDFLMRGKGWYDFDRITQGIKEYKYGDRVFKEIEEGVKWNNFPSQIQECFIELLKRYDKFPNLHLKIKSLFDSMPKDKKIFFISKLMPNIYNFKLIDLLYNQNEEECSKYIILRALKLGLFEKVTKLSLLGYLKNNLHKFSPKDLNYIKSILNYIRRNESINIPEAKVYVNRLLDEYGWGDIIPVIQLFLDKGLDDSILNGRILTYIDENPHSYEKFKNLDKANAELFKIIISKIPKDIQEYTRMILQDSINFNTKSEDFLNVLPKLMAYLSNLGRDSRVMKTIFSRFYKLHLPFLDGNFKNNFFEDGKSDGLLKHAVTCKDFVFLTSAFNKFDALTTVEIAKALKQLLNWKYSIDIEYRNYESKELNGIITTIFRKNCMPGIKINDIINYYLDHQEDTYFNCLTLISYLTLFKNHVDIREIGVDSLIKLINKSRDIETVMGIVEVLEKNDDVWSFIKKKDSLDIRLGLYSYRCNGQEVSTPWLKIMARAQDRILYLAMQKKFPEYQKDHAVIEFLKKGTLPSFGLYDPEVKSKQYLNHKPSIAQRVAQQNYNTVLFKLKKLEHKKEKEENEEKAINPFLK